MLRPILHNPWHTLTSRNVNARTWSNSCKSEKFSEDPICSYKVINKIKIVSVLIDATNAVKSVILARAAPLHRAFSIGLIYTLSDGINDCNCDRFDTKSSIREYTRCEKLQKKHFKFWISKSRRAESHPHTHNTLASIEQIIGLHICYTAQLHTTELCHRCLMRIRTFPWCRL